MRIDVATSCTSCGESITDGAPYCASCGHGQPNRAPGTPDPVELVDPRAMPPLLPPQPSVTTLFLGVGLVVLVLIATVPVLVIRAVFFGPDDAVRGYFSALAARNADAAWAQLDPEGTARAGNPLLSGGALAGPGYQPPTNVTLTAVHTDGADAVASVTYTISGRTYH